jgi:hypothetical protein
VPDLGPAIAPSNMLSNNHLEIIRSKPEPCPAHTGSVRLTNILHSAGQNTRFRPKAKCRVRVV